MPSGWELKSLAGVRHVINRGVAGQQTPELLERFERDVVSASPRSVIVWGFINDIFRAEANERDTALARVRDNYTRMIALARQRGIEPILATEVTVRPKDSWSETVGSWVGWVMGKEAYQDGINRHVLALDQWIKETAAREGLLVLDFQAVLAEPGAAGASRSPSPTAVTSHRRGTLPHRVCRTDSGRTFPCPLKNRNFASA